MSEAEVLGLIRVIAAEELGIDGPVHETSDLYRDLALDSVSLLTLIVALEDRCLVTLSDEASLGLRTVGDLAALVVRTKGERPC